VETPAIATHNQHTLSDMEAPMAEGTLAPNSPKWMQDHVDRYLSSNGADGHMYSIPGIPKPVPTLLLTTTGRRTGQKFFFPLIYGRQGKGYVVIASKGGAPEHPGWYRNLVADPKVSMQVGSEQIRATARTASGTERAQLWKQLAEIYPPYDDYQAKAGAREIPVVVLDPV
jgi:deazaflavin-dependent oxidoreductase (nitroreductase family)